MAGLGPAIEAFVWSNDRFVEKTWPGSSPGMTKRECEVRRRTTAMHGISVPSVFSVVKPTRPPYSTSTVRSARGAKEAATQSRVKRIIR